MDGKSLLGRARMPINIGPYIVHFDDRRVLAGKLAWVNRYYDAAKLRCQRPVGRA